MNGDPAYEARTTKRAVALLVERYRLGFERIELEQQVDVPIGCGFGASAASDPEQAKRSRRSATLWHLDGCNGSPPPAPPRRGKTVGARILLHRISISDSLAWLEVFFEKMKQ